jgi:RNA methyltransferase, TrmH family
MLTRADIKYIKSLQVKKYRKQEQSFIVQGAKSVLELLASDFETVSVYGTDEFLSNVKSRPGVSLHTVRERDLEGLGEFQSNNAALAVAKTKDNKPVAPGPYEFALVLDDIRDPGNLGTIIRTADWFGINKIIASTETADFYNPKVISSTMGSFTRVSIYYTDLENYLSKSKLTVYGTYLDGEDVHKMRFDSSGLIVIGNESHGINTKLEPFISNKITIPKYGKAESLNAGIATAVICDNLRSRLSVHG